LALLLRWRALVPVVDLCGRHALAA
jgi:hypothetical protein